METGKEEIGTRVKLTELKVSELVSFFRKDLDFSKMVYTHWSAKDVLGHLTFWHESFAQNLKDVSEGRKPNPLKGKLSEVNRLSVDSNRNVSIAELTERLMKAQSIIRKHIENPNISSVPYKKGSRDYSRLEHLEIVASHINRHLKDLTRTMQ